MAQKRIESKNFLDSVFFQHWKKTETKKFLDSILFWAISPRCLGLFFFQSWNFRTTLGQTSPCLLEPGFWILTKGIKRQPVRHQTRPNSTKCWGWSNLVNSQGLKVKSNNLIIKSQDSPLILNNIILDGFVVYFPDSSVSINRSIQFKSCNVSVISP